MFVAAVSNGATKGERAMLETTPDPFSSLSVQDAAGGLTGTATEGQDYATIGTITIPAGQTFGTVDVIAMDDPDAEGVEGIYQSVQKSPLYALAAPPTTAPATGPTTAKAAEDDDVKVRQIKVSVADDTTPGAFTNAYSFSFQVKFVVNGENLDHVQILQQIRSSTGVKDWNGQPMSVAAILAGSQADPVVIDSGNIYAVDTKWDWQALNVVAGTSNGVAEHRDNQLYNVENRNLQIGQTVYTQIKRSWTQRDFWIQTRKTGSSQLLSDHVWGYTWSNDNAAWTNQANPPPPAGEDSARGDLGAGSFTGVYGIAGLPW